MDQAWFEMADIRRRGLSNAVWIPLRASRQIQRIGRYGYVGFRDEFFGVGSLAVPEDKKADALQLGWSSVGISHNHAGYVDGLQVERAVRERFRHELDHIIGS